MSTAIKTTDVQALIEEYVRIKDEARALYAQLDDKMTEIVALVPRQLQLDQEVILSDGRKWKLVDNFAEKNIKWQATAVRRFDLLEAKAKRRKNGEGTEEASETVES